jgi:hypothetical protein
MTVFSFRNLFDDLHMKAINCCSTVGPNQKVVPSDFGRKLRLKWDDIMTRVRGDLMAVAWKGKRNVIVLTNIYHPSIRR